MQGLPDIHELGDNPILADSFFKILYICKIYIYSIIVYTVYSLYRYNIYTVYPTGYELWRAFVVNIDQPLFENVPEVNGWEMFDVKAVKTSSSSVSSSDDILSVK